jgi:microcystin-dependent protein
MEPLLGEIKMFCGNFAPDGWYTCEGQTLSISQYTALFSILGTTYGGDGMTTFKLPDLRGAFATQCTNLSGAHPGGTYNYGETGGNQNFTVTSINMPPHTHSIVKGPGTNLAGGVTMGATTINVNNTTTGSVATPTTGNSLSAAEDLSHTSSYVGIYNAQAPNTALNSQTATNANTSTLTFNPAGLSITPWGAGPTPLPTVPNFVAMQYIIAYEGIYPSRP